jgi:hypothetical protein
VPIPLANHPLFGTKNLFTALENKIAARFLRMPLDERSIFRYDGEKIVMKKINGG